MSKYQSRKGQFCPITDCGKPVFCKGHCKRHYNQLWEHGKIIRIEHFVKSKRLPGQNDTALNSAREKLAHARDTYANASGVEARRRWRKSLELIEAEVQVLEAKHAQAKESEAVA